MRNGPLWLRIVIVTGLVLVGGSLVDGVTTAMHEAVHGVDAVRLVYPTR